MTPFRLWRNAALPLAMVVAGVLVIAIANAVESGHAMNQLWSSALFVPDAPLPETENEGLVSVQVRRLSEEESPEAVLLLNTLRASPEGTRIIESMSLDKGEWIVCLPVSDEILSRLLATGRLPEKGKCEALAGDLARQDHFRLDGQPFQVVGRLQRGVGGLGFAYVVRHDDAARPFFAPSTGATTGYIDPDGMDRQRNEAEEVHVGRRSAVIGNLPRTSLFVTLTAILGLMLVALGGSWFQVNVFRYWGGRTTRRVWSLLNEMRDRPVLFTSVHVVLYGLLFAAMLAGVREPLANARMGSFIADEFSRGDLSYIGAAYGRGDILAATAATFCHNYFVATLALSLLPSLIIPMAGFVKNLLTFGVVGFVMSPVWTGAASGYIYHCITMTLELEAYIVASFAVMVLAIRAIRGATVGNMWGQYKRGFVVVAGGALLTAVMLLIAASYEAVTIILFY